MLRLVLNGTMVFLITLFWPLALSAQFQWEQTFGPFTERDDPAGPLVVTDAGSIIAGVSTNISNGGKIFRTTDGGDTWSETQTEVKFLAVQTIKQHPSGTLIAAVLGPPAVLISRDDGDTWQKMELNFQLRLFFELDISPDGDLFLSMAPQASATDNIVIYRLTDLNAMWEQAWDETLGDGIFQLTSGINGLVFAFTGDRQAFRSTDYGDSWERIIISETQGFYVYKYLINENVLLAFTDAGVFRSTDRGSGWSLVSVDLAGKLVTDAIFGSDGSIFAAAGGQLYMSDDTGQSWNTIDIAFELANLINSIDQDSEGALYLGTQYGVFRSEPHERNILWYPTVGVEGRKISVFALADNGFVYCGTDSGVYRSTDHGANWSQSGLEDVGIQALATKGNDMVFAGTRNRVYRSTNSGTDWQFNPMGTDIFSLAIDSLGDIYAGKLWDISRSTDNGNTWFDAFGDEIFQSVRALIALPQGGILASDGLSHIARSDNSGSSWRDVYCGPGTAIHSLSIGPDGLLYAGFIDEAARIDTDPQSCSDNWDHREKGLENIKARALTVNNRGQIFAATDSGAYVVSPNFDRWISKNRGLEHRDAYAIGMNAQGAMLIGTNDGVFRTEPYEISVNVTQTDTDQTHNALDIFPNPALNIVNIAYTLESAANITLRIVDALGRFVLDVPAEWKTATAHSYTFDLSALPSGAYIVQLVTDERITGRMLLIR